MNDTTLTRPIAEATTLVELLRARALQQPDQDAYHFLADGETADLTLTYGQLDRRARAIAGLLRRHGVGAGRVLLLYPPGLDYIAAFFGCLYAGAVAVPAYPPRLNRPMPRLQAIVADAQATVALTTAETLAGMEHLSDAPQLQALRWLATDNLPDRLDEDWHAPDIARDSLAFLQYTSGSTATPKGVMLTHGNLLHNSRHIHSCFEHTAASRGVSWLPPYHDMGLIGGILQPLYGGFPVTLFSPIAFLQRPLRWLQAITRERATTSGGPNFAYDLCVRKITPEQRTTLDLSSWKVALNGAEPIRHETIAAFVAAFAPCGFRREAFFPAYGLAEATLLVTGNATSDPPHVYSFQGLALEQHQARAASADEPDGRVLVGCGQALADQQIMVVEPQACTPCQPDEVGEIWVAGPSVAQGYWNRPAATDYTFAAQLADTGAGPFLRTGDLGFLHAGELFITGRLKDLIIIRGRNHYPQDIELTVERSHPALRPGCGAAVSVPSGGEEQLVIVQEIERQQRHPDIAALAQTIRQAVGEQHALPVYAVVLIRAGTIPKTSSGKIQRHVCAAAFRDGTLEVVGASTPDDMTAPAQAPVLRRDALLAMPTTDRRSAIEGYVRQQIGRLLQVAEQRLDCQQPLGSLGLDSLMVVELQHSLEAQLGVILPMGTLLKSPSIIEIATEIADQLTRPMEDMITLAHVQERSRRQPLSFGQQALWFLHRLAPESTAYHVVHAVRLRGSINSAALRRTFQRLVDRHPALRTIFPATESAPAQEILETAEVCFEICEAAGWSDSVLQEQLVVASQRPFDLEHGPLLRVQLFRRSADEHVLLLTLHHIVTDLWSLVIVLDEITRIYPGECTSVPVALPAPELDYADYVYWQTGYLTSPAGTALQSYWQQQLAGTMSSLALPTDHARPPVQTTRGAAYSFVIEPEVTGRLKALAQAEGATLYVMLLAAFETLLYRWSGQGDFLVGSPSSGRSRAQLTGLAGYFVNPIVLRAQLSERLTFSNLLHEVHQTVLQALAHQDYPFPLLIERLQPARDPSRSPLFQVMFVLEQTPQMADERIAPLVLGQQGSQLPMGDLVVESFPLEQRMAQFDLTLSMTQVADGMTASLEYNADLFEATTMSQLARQFVTLLQSIATAPDRSLAALPIMTTAERQHMLVAWNANQAAFPTDMCMQQLFEAQVARTPDAVAVVWQQEQLTYNNLDRRANQLAHHLRRLGIRAEMLVGLCMERSLELPIAILAVLKAGAAYLPLDPNYPQERLALILADSRASILLTQRRLLAQLPPYAGRVVFVDEDWAAIAQQQSTPLCLARTPHPAQPAYAIYTSGSTGTPKGVLIPHQALVNHAHAMIERYGLTATDRVLQFASISFDVAAEELFPTWLCGATVVLWPQHEVVAPRAFQTFVDQAQLTVLNLPTPYWHVWIADLAQSGTALPLSLRHVIVGSERALPDQLATWQRITDRRVGWSNAYGPTEATITSTVYTPEAGQAAQDDRIVAVGRPIANTQLYLLDPLLQPVPIGLPGEVYIGGAGLARGYLNRPALTAACFVPDPFGATTGGRLYRTGDLGRYRPDGSLELIGRIDQQVKMRGFRIELGEIEAVLSQHPEVREAVVVAHEATTTDMRLVAYVVTGQLADTADDLRSFLQTKLPAYMIPAIFIFLDTLPLAPNGKIDYRALPPPDEKRPQLATAYLAPSSDLEQTIATIWHEVLQLEKVGTQDNFFDVGGHSLLAVQLHQKLCTQLERDIPIVELFRHPTIRSLAQYLDHSSDVTTRLGGHSRAETRRALMNQRKNRTPASAAVRKEHTEV